MAEGRILQLGKPGAVIDGHGEIPTGNRRCAVWAGVRPALEVPRVAEIPGFHEIGTHLVARGETGGRKRVGAGRLVGQDDTTGLAVDKEFDLVPRGGGTAPSASAGVQNLW